MNKFLTFAGTQPVYLGDIDFMQTAAANAVKQLARALMDSGSDSLNAILQGVELQWNSSTLTITPGVVVLDGELLPFEGVTLQAPSSLYFHIESTLSGERTFKDGESHQCHETRKAIINTTSTGGIIVGNVPRLHVPSDDVEYDYTSSNGFITGGKLIKKNGFWYLELEVDVSEESSTLACNIEFTVPASVNQLLNDVNIPAPMALKASSYIFGIQNMFCQSSYVSTTTLRFTLSFEGAQAAYGAGKNIFMLPIL